MSKTPIKAIAVFDGKVKGQVIFTENLVKNTVILDIQLTGLKKMHYTDFTCTNLVIYLTSVTACVLIFNPYGKNHGCPGVKDRHVGDLGNLQTDKNGYVNYQMEDDCIKLRGTVANIIGRGLIVHADPDDCGLGENDASKINGNAGKRIGCAIIGYSQENFRK